MLSSLYSVTMFTAAMAVLCALVETMIPQGKLKSTVLLAIGVVFLLALAAPIESLVRTQAPGWETEGTQIAQQTQPPATYEGLLRGYYEQSAAKQG